MKKIYNKILISSSLLIPVSSFISCVNNIKEEKFNIPKSFSFNFETKIEYNKINSESDFSKDIENAYKNHLTKNKVLENINSNLKPNMKSSDFKWFLKDYFSLKITLNIEKGNQEEKIVIDKSDFFKETLKKIENIPNDFLITNENKNSSKYKKFFDDIVIAKIIDIKKFNQYFNVIKTKYESKPLLIGLLSKSNMKLSKLLTFNDHQIKQLPLEYVNYVQNLDQEVNIALSNVSGITPDSYVRNKVKVETLKNFNTKYFYLNNVTPLTEWSIVKKTKYKFFKRKITYKISYNSKEETFILDYSKYYPKTLQYLKTIKDNVILMKDFKTIFSRESTNIAKKIIEDQRNGILRGELKNKMRSELSLTLISFFQSNGLRSYIPEIVFFPNEFHTSKKN